MQGRLKDPQGNVLLTLRQNSRYIIGRELAAGDTCLNLDDPYVSRRHGVFSFEEELYYTDAGSRNGSRINGKTVPEGQAVRLADGDRILVGQTQLRLQMRKSRSGIRLHQGPEIRITANAAGEPVVTVRTKPADLISYGIRMLDKNRPEGFPVPDPVSGTEGNRFEYTLPGCVTLKDYLREELPPSEYRFIAEGILAAIRKGESYLLEEKQLLMDPQTVYLTNDGEVRLLYLPVKGMTREGFFTGLKEVFSCISAAAPQEEKPVFQRLISCLEGNGNRWECSKLLYLSRRRDAPSPRSRKESRRDAAGGKRKMPPGSRLMIASFLIFLALYWLADLSLTNLCGVGLILAGFNVLAAGLRPKAKKETGKHTREREPVFFRRIASGLTDIGK